MHILYLHQYFALPESTGGTRSYEFARRFVAGGHRVTLVTSDAYLPAAHKGQRRFTVHGITVHALPTRYSNRMAFHRRLWAFLRFAVFASRHAVLTAKVDLVFASSTPLTIAIPALLARWLRGRRFLLEIRDLWPTVPIAMGVLTNPLAIALARWLEATAYRAASHIVALSPDMADGIARQGIAQSKITVLPNASDRALFAQGEADRFRAAFPALRDRPFALYAGTFGMANDAGKLVDIAVALEACDSPLAVVMIGDGREREEIRTRAERAGVLNGRLTMLAPLAKTEIIHAYAACAVSISTFRDVPALWANSANKVFDALAAGRPIAINHRGWLAEVIAETGCGLVMPADDATEAARLLDGFVRDPERLQNAARAAAVLAAERFDRDHLFAALERLCRKAIEA